MSQARVVYNLVDADGCTYNKNYRQRLLYCISKYRHIIEENGAKLFLTKSQVDLLSFFEEKLLHEQVDFFMSEDAYAQLLVDFEAQAYIFNSMPVSEDGKRKTDIRLGGFLFHFIESIEKIWASYLRTIYISANKVLTNAIEKQKQEYAEVYIGLGSNRHAWCNDDLNKRQRGTASIFTDLEMFADVLEVKLDKFTQTDLYGDDMHIGDNFRRILAGENVAAKNAFDETKANIVYAVAHRVIDKHPNAKVTLNLWDDQKGILESLKTFYRAHPELLPEGLILKLRRYNGELKETTKIIGTGQLDGRYKKNTVLMGAMCGYDLENKPVINIAEELDVDAFLKKRSVRREVKEKVSGQSLFKVEKVISAPIGRQPTPIPDVAETPRQSWS